MNAIARFFKKVGMLLRRERYNSDLDEEMSFHREQKERELREAGLGADAAHHVAMREFGNSTRLKEQSHEVVGFQFETVWQDLHFAIRQLRRSPGFTVTAVLDAGTGNRRERSYLLVCRCRVDQAASVSGSGAAGRCG